MVIYQKNMLNDLSADNSIRMSFNSVESKKLGTTSFAKGFIPQSLESSDSAEELNTNIWNCPFVERGFCISVQCTR